jgi:hypothetical protein
MSVDPLKSNALPHADPGVSGPTSAARHSGAHPTVESRQEHPAATAGDRVQLAASRSLADWTDEANCVPEAAVSPERMRAVLRRLQQDYYSNAEVQDKVAHAVRQDLGLSRTE